MSAETKTAIPGFLQSRIDIDVQGYCKGVIDIAFTERAGEKVFWERDFHVKGFIPSAILEYKRDLSVLQSHFTSPQDIVLSIVRHEIYRAEKLIARELFRWALLWKCETKRKKLPPRFMPTLQTKLESLEKPEENQLIRWGEGQCIICRTKESVVTFSGSKSFEVCSDTCVF